MEFCGADWEELVKEGSSLEFNPICGFGVEILLLRAELTDQIIISPNLKYNSLKWLNTKIGIAQSNLDYKSTLKTVI